VRELLGITPEEWIEDPYCWRHHVHPEDIDRAWDEYVEAYRHQTSLSHEYRMVHADGHVLWVSEQAFIVRNEAGEPWLIQGVIFDITERKKAEDQVAFLAYHDKLTGLPNRVLFEETLELALARARRHDLGVGVLFLDLDNFKLVNDSLGHHAGDELLIQLADRLRDCTRDTDMVARQGGDEFLLLLSDLERGAGPVPGTHADLVVAEQVAERVTDALRAPFDLSGTQFFATASVGVSLCPRDADDATSLLRNADAAMYQAKRSGPGTYVIFVPDGSNPGERLSLTTRLRHAVEAQDWELHYQPIVELATERVLGVEALVRWRDPNGGLVPPGEFIPLAEELGLIEAIGDWVTDELARQSVAWRSQGIELDMSVNLSPRELWSAQLPERILGKLKAAHVDPKSVTVEVTESTAMADPERTQRILNELHAWGLTIALDDFGTGYSSLRYLTRLPVDTLKLDRNFVAELNGTKQGSAVAESVIRLGQALHLDVVAEGIEQPAQAAELALLGCRAGQGYLYAPPLSPSEVDTLLSGTPVLTPSR
jgi:diguanylate cyclase (GGDEF)-like protein/PAS domain S-box-containing protein